MKSKKKQNPKKQKNSSEIASSQNTLTFQELSESGLLTIDDKNFSKTYKVGNINYVTASEIERTKILSKYNAAINSLSDKEHFQATLLVLKNSKEEYLKAQSNPLQGGKLDLYAKEMNSLLEQNYDKGRNNFIVERFITIATEAETDLRAETRLENVISQFGQELRSLKISLTELSPNERITLMNKILRPHKKNSGKYEDVLNGNYRVQDLIAPEAIDFPNNKRCLTIEGRPGQVMYLKNFPRNLSDGLTKDLTEAETEMVINIHASPYSLSTTNKKLFAAATDIEEDVVKRQQKASGGGSGLNLIARSTREAHKEVNEQIEFIAETGDKQSSCTYMVYIWGNNEEELQDAIAKVNGVGERYGAVFSPLFFVQEEALNSSLPIGKNFVDIEKNYVRDLITPNVSINSLWTSADIQHKNGKYYGINQLSKNNIIINRKDKSLLNGNGGIMATTGGGKSFASKQEIISTAINSPNDEVIILDVEREYVPLAEEFGWDTITIAPGTDTFLNLLELPPKEVLDPKDNPVALKSSLLISMFDYLLNGITSNQETIIDRVTTEVYKRFETPSLQEWDLVLSEDKSLDAELLRDNLALYITGSLNNFSKKTTKESTGRFTVYDINALQNKYKDFGYIAILDIVWNKVVENKKKGITTWVYFDEFQVIMSPGQGEILREKAANIYARIRKYGGLPTFMTQSAEIMMSTPQGRAILFNSAFLVLLENSGVVDELASHYKLSEDQASYLESGIAGEGLIIAGKAVLPFSNIIPEDTRLYKLLDTKA
ncbi:MULTISPECIES: VirB4-like conjugal transfer ATPase, CD1110 family [Lactococcus]|uniref:DUF87 domain-containing protein n=1 Tax=Lactococcus petauri TaxID=1940789 RepID=A0AAJ2J024_9LACT|nr:MULTISPECIES: DUF87 domain-containing protein [Lactococcus]MCO7181330.1 DUF87 domain-containing protein [Lactococcus formosensis]MDT2527994.1 DUF87 domain-containing protein [Lactococcus petauri]MDT2542537.1 DUF87 domain-containing protein [Lactococcus petauri]MDT2552522.1 DUF87 domain-containing protein [Lactococcus petauri]MDT2559137.1 DUF87 domain-containing protein [Lactococcus petauri]